MGRVGKAETREQKTDERGDDRQSSVPKVFTRSGRPNEKVLRKPFRKREKKICSSRSRKIRTWRTKVYLWAAGMQSNNHAGRKRRIVAWRSRLKRSCKKKRWREEKDH